MRSGGISAGRASLGVSRASSQLAAAAALAAHQLPLAALLLPAGLVELLCRKGGAVTAAPSPGLPSSGMSGIQSVGTPRRGEETRVGPAECGAAAAPLCSTLAPEGLPALSAALLRELSRHLPPAGRQRGGTALCSCMPFRTGCATRRASVQACRSVAVLARC